MSCREFEADVVDLARGAQMSVAAQARLAAHLEQCAGCAARVARERQLTRALKAVADSTPASSRAAAIEEQLLAAFAARPATTSLRAQASRPIFAAPAAWRGLAAAAVLMLAVAVWQGTARWRVAEDVRPPSTQAAASPAVSTPAALPAGTPAPDRAGAPIRVPAERTPSPGAPRSARARRTPGPRAVPATDDEVLQFVTLPTAIGLPALESGRIVRVDVPTAMLAAYGFEVAPDSRSGMVEADVLVGQDGQPRAIRFVSLDSDSRRRQ